ncbi:MAG: dihydrodipicolinate synthase family protein [Desulfuromonadales bacterium]|nr:dihydrodipicolinate synthase family protein [Desulfuromonadales bacterium]MBN2792726.1 dihydrodipicolinate synthase family protein [Desulfuromonadales bacterium]
MASEQRIRGILAPVITPFKADLSPDPERLITHCKWLLSQNCGLAVFGTNSEANSLSVNEKKVLLDRLTAAGIDPSRMMPGTGSCSLSDSVELTRHAVTSGCAGVLMLPPFYYKNVSEDGLYRYFAEVVERVGDARLKIYLYHIPPVAVVGITAGLVERLLKNYPSAIAGMKDSSGDWSNTKMMLDNFAEQGFDVFTGNETFLLANMQNGGAGCISATANVNPAAIDRLYREWQHSDATTQQQNLNSVRQTVGQAMMIAALKSVVAHYAEDSEWMTVRPPLTELDQDQVNKIVYDLEQLGFSMPDLPVPGH